jgi:hypothetical protein
MTFGYDTSLIRRGGQGLGRGANAFPRTDSKHDRKPWAAQNVTKQLGKFEADDNWTLLRDT